MARKSKKNTLLTSLVESYSGEITVNNQTFKAKGDSVMEVLDKMNPLDNGVVWVKTKGILRVLKGKRVYESLLSPQQFRKMFNKFRIKLFLKHRAGKIEYLLNR